MSLALFQYLAILLLRCVHNPPGLCYCESFVAVCQGSLSVTAANTSTPCQLEQAFTLSFPLMVNHTGAELTL